jgi:hypothetical protein
MAESARQFWEYRVERHYPDDAPSHGESRGSGLSSFAAKLCEFGADGWELVAVVPLMPYELILRRPLVEDVEKKKE